MTNKTVKTTKANNTNKLMLTGKGKMPKRTKSEVITALVSELTAPVSVTSEVAVTAPVSAPVTPAPAPAPVAAIAEATSKRITPGAAITEWRVVRSQRTAQPGFFVQGGSFQMQVNGRNHFVCGAELFFEDRAAAFGALAERKTPAAA